MNLRWERTGDWTVKIAGVRNYVYGYFNLNGYWHYWLGDTRNAKQPDNKYKECPNCGRVIYSGLPRCSKCQTVYLDGYDEGFNEGVKAGQHAFESTLNMVFGKAESK